jgi:hypothetical protein
MLLSHASPFGNSLLITPYNSQCWLSTLLLFSQPRLSILLLVEVALVRLFLDFSIPTNRQRSLFQPLTNTKARQNLSASRVLPTAFFTNPKNAFSTIII